MAGPRTLFEVLTAAVADMSEHGFDSQQRVDYWVAEIRRAAEAQLTPLHDLDEQLRSALRAVYTRLVERGGLQRLHPGVARFTLEKVRPALRAELDRRILASANLIKLNRAQAIEKTLQRFQGWSTSIPAGGSTQTDRVREKQEIRKSLAQLPFIERRVLVDQGHKLSSAVSAVLAHDGGAIAAIWHSHWRQAGYDYREDHKDRDDQVYLIRGSWAHQRGLVKSGKVGYTDQVTQPAEEVFCRCQYQYLYNLRDLPDDMVTERGRRELAEVRARLGTA